MILFNAISEKMWYVILPEKEYDDILPLIGNQLPKREYSLVAITKSNYPVTSVDYKEILKKIDWNEEKEVLLIITFTDVKKIKKPEPEQAVEPEATFDWKTPKMDKPYNPKDIVIRGREYYYRELLIFKLKRWIRNLKIFR